jgi:hypothetical protein
LLARANDIALQRWRTAIKDEDRLDAEVQELANAAEETDDVTVAQSIALFVAYGFQELVDPDGGVYGESLTIERFELRWASAWLDDGP